MPLQPVSTTRHDSTPGPVIAVHQLCSSNRETSQAMTPLGKPEKDPSTGPVMSSGSPKKAYAPKRRVLLWTKNLLFGWPTAESARRTIAHRAFARHRARPASRHPCTEGLGTQSSALLCTKTSPSVTEGEVAVFFGLEEEVPLSNKHGQVPHVPLFGIRRSIVIWRVQGPFTFHPHTRLMGLPFFADQLGWVWESGRHYIPDTTHGTAIGLPIRPGVVDWASVWGGSPNWQSHGSSCMVWQSQTRRVWPDLSVCFHPDAHGPSYGGVWGLKSLGFGGTKSCERAFGQFYSTNSNDPEPTTCGSGDPPRPEPSTLPEGAYASRTSGGPTSNGYSVGFGSKRPRTCGGGPTRLARVSGILGGETLPPRLSPPKSCTCGRKDALGIFGLSMAGVGPSIAGVRALKTLCV